MMLQIPDEVTDGLSTEELECKICYCTYSLSSRRPKILECCHCLCSKCLAKLLDLCESPNAVVCPFCRYVTGLPGESIASLPDDFNRVSVLSIQNRYQLNVHENQGEILLSPGRLSSLVGHSASASPSSVRSNYVVITIVESPQEQTISRDYRSSSFDSMASVMRHCTVWNCTMLLCQASAQALLWFLGMLYFSSLPLGIYLLIIKKTILGAMLLGLVPVSLLVIMMYGMCQCICHEFCDCVQN